MLTKCLRYDLAAVLRLVWILLIVIFCAVLGVGGGFRVCGQLAVSLSDTIESSNAIIFATLGIIGSYLFSMACILVIGGCFTVGTILAYWRVYSNFFTDEGYLTFTLPVKRSTLYLSKVITCTLVEVLMTVAAVAAAVLIVPFVLPTTEGFSLINPEFFKSLAFMFKDMWTGLSFWPFLWILMIPFFSLVSMLASNGLILLCLTLGASVFKKGKLLGAIGFYWLVNALTYVVTQLASFPLTFAMTGLMMAVFGAGPFVAGLTLTVGILVITAAIACGAALLHFTNLTLLERKLNLA